ncbi:unnamed protein product [Camellia sinensis]
MISDPKAKICSSNFLFLQLLKYLQEQKQVVYPKVKVREQEEDDDLLTVYDHDKATHLSGIEKRSSFLVWCHEHIEEHQQKREDGMGSLKMCCVVRDGQGVRLWSDQSHGNSPLVWECEDDSPPSIVRIPKSYIANSAIPMIPLPKGEGKSSNKKKAMEDSRPNIRSSPIPRPRAVLSSPVNDGVIGGRNKAKIEVLSGLKDHNLRQTRHTQCKVIPRRSTVETPITTKRESKEAADGKTDLEQKKESAKANPRQRADLRKGKFDSV